MNSLEASLELLKLIIASEKFVNLDLAQRTEIVLNSFQTIYERVCEMKVNSVLEDFEAKTDRIKQYHEIIFSRERADSDDNPQAFSSRFTKLSPEKTNLWRASVKDLDLQHKNSLYKSLEEFFKTAGCNPPG